MEKSQFWFNFFHFQIFEKSGNKIRDFIEISLKSYQHFRSYRTLSVKLRHTSKEVQSMPFQFRYTNHIFWHAFVFVHAVLIHMIKIWYYFQYVFNSWKLETFERVERFVWKNRRYNNCRLTRSCSTFTSLLLKKLIVASCFFIVIFCYKDWYIFLSPISMLWKE